MGRSRFFVAGRAAQSTAFPAFHGVLWNPHGSMALRVLYFEGMMSQTTAATRVDVTLRRTTTRGTPGSTVTPDVDGHVGRRSGPASGALLDLGVFSVAPTQIANDVRKAAFPGQGPASGGLSWVFKGGLLVPAGTGLALVQLGDGTTNSTWDLTFGWDE